MKAVEMINDSEGSKEDSGGPWKVSKCRAEELEETLNDLIAAGYLIHTLYPGEESGNQTFTIAAIEQKYVQPAQILTEEQQKALRKDTVSER